jgi:hypothetical protein
MRPKPMKGHLISMRGPGNVPKPGTSLAVCECGWESEVPWGEYETQDRAIYAHWETAYAPNISNGTKAAVKDKFRFASVHGGRIERRR